MKSGARAWPAQFPSDAFAERVVRAALAERSSRVVEATELFADDASIDREVRRWRAGRRRFTRSAWAMVALMVLTMGIGAAYVGNRQREMAQRRAVAPAVVANSPTTGESVHELEAEPQGVEKREQAISDGRVALEEALKMSSKTRLVQRAVSVPAAARPKAASSADTTSKKGCRCPAGDALCTCL